MADNQPVERPIDIDAPLIRSVRHGVVEAYGQLYERHVAAAYNLARQVARSSAEADDVVSEAFVRVLALLRVGRGPDVAFRAYLFTVLRRIAYDRTRRDRRILVGDVADLAPPAAVSVPFHDTTIAAAERDLVARAFAELPERWQAALWYTEIKNVSPAEAALRFDVTANSMSALAYRARNRLASAYVQAHLADTDVTRSCRSTFPLLAAWIRNTLSKQARCRVERHLQDCQRCRARAHELHEVNPRRRCDAKIALRRRVGAA